MNRKASTVRNLSKFNFCNKAVGGNAAKVEESLQRKKNSQEEASAAIVVASCHNLPLGGRLGIECGELDYLVRRNANADTVCLQSLAELFRRLGVAYELVDCREAAYAF